MVQLEFACGCLNGLHAIVQLKSAVLPFPNRVTSHTQCPVDERITRRFFPEANALRPGTGISRNESNTFRTIQPLKQNCSTSYQTNNVLIHRIVKLIRARHTVSIRSVPMPLFHHNLSQTQPYSHNNADLQ